MGASSWPTIEQPRGYGKFALSITVFSDYCHLSQQRSLSFSDLARDSDTRVGRSIKLNYRLKYIANRKTKQARMIYILEQITTHKILRTIQPNDFIRRTLLKKQIISPMETAPLQLIPTPWQLSLTSQL